MLETSAEDMSELPGVVPSDDTSAAETTSTLETPPIPLLTIPPVLLPPPQEHSKTARHNTADTPGKTFFNFMDKFCLSLIGYFKMSTF